MVPANQRTLTCPTNLDSHRAPLNSQPKRPDVAFIVERLAILPRIADLIPSGDHKGQDQKAVDPLTLLHSDSDPKEGVESVRQICVEDMSGHCGCYLWYHRQWS